MNWRRVFLLSVFCAVLAVTSSFAADPPGRVARLNYMTGQVSIQPNGVNEWVSANINRPLTTSDRIWTDRDSRAELQMGAASARLNSETSLTLANVSDNAVQLQLDQGTLNLHVIKLYDGEIYEIDTPNLAFTVQKSGDYRFDVDNAGDTTIVTVFKGRGEATGDNPGIKISGNQQFTFRGGRSLQYSVTNAPGYDGFDSWCMARANREDRSPSLAYVSPYAVGYSDLDEYGRWENMPPYGPVWIPTSVAYGWAPYRWGHWVFIAPWGWTWVDDAPWGFAPFHYGRWVSFGSYWGWCPGPVYARPIYAPALVAWVGGSHWGVGLSFGVGGGVGWFPLGWGEPYIPYYGGYSRHYFQNVNVTNTQINNITYITNNYYGNGHPVRPIRYVNQQPGAVTAVSNATFVQSRPTRTAVVPVSAQALTGVTAIHDVPMRPTRESVVGPSQHTNAPPATAFSRPVVTRMPAPAAASSGAVAPTVSSDQPGRSVRGAPSTAPPATYRSTETMDRPTRQVPRPPQTGSVPSSIAEEQSPRAVPHPPSNDVPSRGTRTVPGNVAVPPPMTGPLDSGAPSRGSRGSVAPSTPPAVSAPVTQPSNVPRPPAGYTPAPAPTTSAPVTPRPTRDMSDESRAVPHPTVTASPGVQHPVVRSNEMHTPPAVTAPPTSAPPHVQSAPPQNSQPSRGSRAPEQKSEPKTDTKQPSRSQLGYPSPYGGTVRPASFTSTSSYPHPTGTVAAVPRVSYQQRYSSAPIRTSAPSNTRSAASYSRSTPSYVRSAPIPHYSGGSSAAHASHAPTPSASHSSPSSGSHTRTR